MQELKELALTASIGAGILALAMVCHVLLGGESW